MQDHVRGCELLRQPSNVREQRCVRCLARENIRRRPLPAPRLVVYCRVPLRLPPPEDGSPVRDVRVIGIAFVTVVAWSALAAGNALAASGSPPVRPATTRYAKVRQVCPPPKPRDATCFALALAPAPGNATGVRPYQLGAGASSKGPAGGLTPADLASAYGYLALGGWERTDGRDRRCLRRSRTSKETSARSTASTGSRPARRRTAASRRSVRRAARRHCPRPTRRAGRSRCHSTWRPCTASARTARSCWSRPTRKAWRISRRR